ncbi:beta-lactamase family protein [Sphingomonas sp. A2-49]|uniref:serine hydrolase domain-containing protein n=1 Tax=Sphingomonas sp. A2-49 TaxID=1391375 RepID=UPI0021CFDFF8|nr:serine hydrolase domain-containing protein [Sphingomonas sp. A2-49]MCU6454601.1 beta-lactamase family protein [Sphingomonas sp. A2-49]
MILSLALAAAAGGLSARVDAVADRARLAGVLLVARGDRVLVEKGYGTVSPGGGAMHDPRARWRLASITKQVTAALLLRDHPAALDAPVARPGGPRGATLAVTLRQLLTHHSGLANPDDTPAAAGSLPAFYTRAAPDLGYCLSRPTVPGSAFAYNNCDYLVAAAATGGVRGWPAGMTMARGMARGVPGFVGGRPEPAFRLAAFGAAGGLTGTARSVFRFDRALMTGMLLLPPLRAELWTPEGGGSYQALGAWVFPGRLAGCAAPVRIVQRDGEIGGVQTRNYILPDADMVVVVFTNRSSDDFPIGEIWQGKGFAFDLLSAAVCGKDMA